MDDVGAAGVGEAAKDSRDELEDILVRRLRLA